MDLGLGLNLNNFAGLQGAKATGTTPAMGTSAAPESFKNQLSATSQDSKGFNGKPVDLPIQDSSPIMEPPSVPVSMDRLIQPSVEVAQGPKVLPAVQVDSLTHRVAWQRFLQKMKSELGVSAEEILKAFQKLSPQELAQPPEKNVDKLVDLLGLNPEQSQIASQLFVDLIRKTGSKPLAQELKSSNREISLTVMSQREQEQKRLNQTLSKMNDRFFMKDVKETPVKREQVQILQSGQEVSPELLAKMKPVNEEEGKEILKRLSLKVQETPVQDLGKVIPKESSLQGQDQTPVQVQNQTQIQAQTQTQTQIQTEVQGQAQQQQLVAKQTEPQKDTLSQILEKSVRTDAVNSDLPAPSDKKVVSKENTSSENSLAQNGDASLAATDLSALSEVMVDKSSFQKALGAAGLAASAEAVKGHDAVTPEDLIQKAQVMVRDGGGDVKMVLQPEGLGEVAMKVKVNGDKVSVEMITESDVAKKMIEKGMADLKAHLHANNLSLESIKINTASQLGHQLEQQYQDAQRQQAHQFMQQFSQGNQNFRRGFFEMPGAKIYQSQTKARGSQVEGVEAPRKKEGSRLNLVA